MRGREAGALRDQLDVTPGVDHPDRRTVVTVGPLGVILTGGPGERGWLLAGHSQQATALLQAADDVLSGFVYTGDDR